MHDEIDRDLVARVRAGDPSAMDALLARHRPWVRQVCLRFLRSDDAAGDATQEVCARVIDRFNSFRGDNFPGWLKAIAVNCCLNIIDRERRWLPLGAEDLLASPAPAPEAALLRAERAARVRQVLAGLPPRQKLVFCMKYIDNCSYHDIERLTGFTPNEVKSYLQNARRNFSIAWRTNEEVTS